jgi:protein-glutamine gamma-glutamyltransferase
VGGYKGGYYNGMGGYYLVPEKNAHVWVEVYQRDTGWLRIDPTPPATERIASPTGESALLRIGLFLDTMNYYWYAVVINYNLEKQVSFVRSVRGVFKKTHFDPALLRNTKGYLKYLGMVILAGVLCILIRTARLKPRSPEERLLTSFLKKMQRSGYAKKPSQGLEEFVSGVADERVKDAASVFVKEFEALYFRDRPISPDRAKSLHRIIRSI